MRDCVIESRHLGLMLPGEIEGLRERIGRLAEQMEESLDMEGLIALARRGRRDRKPAGTPSVLRAVSSAVCRVRIGVARDQAFCFYYQENLRLMEELGAELVFFSLFRIGSFPRPTVTCSGADIRKILQRSSRKTGRC